LRLLTVISQADQNLKENAVYRFLSILLLCSLALFPNPTPASTEAAEAPSSESSIPRDRNWTITIPLWVPGYAGQFAVGEVEVEGESSGGSGFFERFFDNEVKLNFFFMGAFSYERDRWRVHGDVFGGKFTDDVIYKRTDGTIVSASLRPFIPRLHLDYRLLDHSWGDSGNQEVEGWIYAGVRYHTVAAEVDVAQRTESLNADWVDPIVGAWIPVNLSNRWWFELSGDVGGFNVGSKLSWSLYAGVTCRASSLISFTLAYNVLDVDYEGTVGSEDFFWRARVAGPGLGIRFSF